MTEKTFEDYIDKAMREAAKNRREIGTNLNNLINSDAGKSLIDLINDLAATMKDDYMFSEEDRDRAEIRGGVIALNKLLSLIVELSRDGVATSGREEDDLFIQSSSYAVPGAGE